MKLPIKNSPYDGPEHLVNLARLSNENMHYSPVMLAENNTLHIARSRSPTRKISQGSFYISEDS